MTNRLATDLDNILARTEPLWQELRGQRILITGATGFFGCWLLESFAWANRRLNLDARRSHCPGIRTRCSAKSASPGAAIPPLPCMPPTFATAIFPQGAVFACHPRRDRSQRHAQSRSARW